MDKDTIYDGAWVKVERSWAYHPRFVYEIKVYTTACYPEGSVTDTFDVEGAEKLRGELDDAIVILKRSEKPD
jgi:hypothetical protein